MQKFEQALTKLIECLGEIKQDNLLLWAVKKSAAESQVNDLQQEIEDYELLNCH